MDFKKIASSAKQALDKRGGTESLKQDAGELKNIAKGPGSLKDKAKAAVDAIKSPGEEAGAAEGAKQAGRAEGAKHAAGADEAPVGPSAGEGERPQGGHRREGHGQGRHGEGRRQRP
jgi:hypothetical protein